jgi:hypothetical protein
MGRRLPALSTFSLSERSSCPFLGCRKLAILVVVTVNRDAKIVRSCSGDGCLSGLVKTTNSWTQHCKELSNVASFVVNASVRLCQYSPGLKSRTTFANRSKTGYGMSISAQVALHSLLLTTC